jgi:hypothetical protein
VGGVGEEVVELLGEIERRGGRGGVIKRVFLADEGEAIDVGEVQDLQASPNPSRKGMNLLGISSVIIMAREDTVNEPEMCPTVAFLFDSEESSCLCISDSDTCVFNVP